MSDVFIASVRRSLRASLFHKLKPFGLSQDDVNKLVSQAVARAIDLSNLRDLAALAQAGGEVAVSLEAVAPDDPALSAFKDRRDNAPGAVRDLFRAEV